MSYNQLSYGPNSVTGIGGEVKHGVATLHLDFDQTDLYVKWLLDTPEQCDQCDEMLVQAVNSLVDMRGDLAKRRLKLTKA